MSANNGGAGGAGLGPGVSTAASAIFGSVPAGHGAGAGAGAGAPRIPVAPADVPRPAPGSNYVNSFEDFSRHVGPSPYAPPGMPLIGQGAEDAAAAEAMLQATMKAQLDRLWDEQNRDMDELRISDKNTFKNHNDLPLARIKRIMKSDEDVRMISAEAPVLFAKACEMFILELTLRSWCYSEKSKRKTLEKEDIQTALRRTDAFDFLAEVVK